MNLWDVSQDQIVEALPRNAAAFPLLEATWLPVMRERLLAKGDASADWLLNPIFRWCFLGRIEKLRAFEGELEQVTTAGVDVHAFAVKLMREIGMAPSANQAHDRMLDARAELRGLLHYAQEGHRVALEPEDSGPAHDFNALDPHGNVAVEAKFIRRSDKVGTYIHRWLESQTELSRSDLFSLPLIHFRWRRDLGRNELTAAEIAALNEFLRYAVTDHRTPRTLLHERVDISFRYDAMPSATAIGSLPNLVEPLRDKISAKVDDAWDRQLANARAAGRPLACFILVNVDDDTEFFQGDRYQADLSALTTEWHRRGLRLVIDPNAHYI